jgi:hypothetical protein
MWNSSQAMWRLHLKWKRLLNMLSIVSSAYRSFRGHLRIQPSTELPSVRFGSELVRSPAGDLRVNTRSLARSIYTQMLAAKYPWADTVDLRIFLMGFDAGEQWRLCSPYSEAEKPTEHAWLPLAEKELGSVLSTIVQAISEYNGQTSDVMPADIAGVTRSDKCIRQKL